MRLEKKTAIVVGGGQQPGDSIGNGKATCVLFAREGAHVAVVGGMHGCTLHYNWCYLVAENICCCVLRLEILIFLNVWRMI